MEAADTRYELVLAEALRAIQNQDGQLDTLRDRAGSLVAVAALVTSFLGGSTVTHRHHLPGVGVAALILFGVCLLLVLAVLWPYSWRLVTSPKKLISEYIECEDPLELTGLRRDLALHIWKDYEQNASRLANLWVYLQVALVTLFVEIILWTVALLR